MQIKTVGVLFASVIMALTLAGNPVMAFAEDGNNEFRHAFPEPVILIDAGHGGIDGEPPMAIFLKKTST